MIRFDHPRRWLPVATAALAVSVLHGGEARIEPEKPKPGGKISLIYRVESGQPGLQSAGEAFVLVRWIAEGIEHRTTIGLSKADKGVRSSTFVVPENAAYLRFSFVNRWENDADADLRVKIWADAERPVRGAWQAEATAIFPGECNDQDQCDYDEPLDKELRLYPDNLPVHISRWWRDRLHRQAGIEERMSAFVAGLPKESESENAERLRLRLTAKLLRGSVRAGGVLFAELVERHPGSPQTYLAAVDVRKVTRMFLGVPGFDDETLDGIVEHVSRYPAAPLSRPLLYLLRDRLSLETVDAVCSAWMEDDPGDPEPAMLMALIFEQRGGSPERILDVTERASDWMLTGETRIRVDPGGWARLRYLTPLQLMHGRALLGQQRTAAALGAARLAAKHEREGESRAEMLEAEIWRSAGRPDLAEEALIAAMRDGDPAVARDELISIYVELHGDADGFETHLELLEQRLAPEIPGAFDPAEVLDDLSWKTLDGAELASDAWKGKVLVINFWAMGCGPCILEMPALNEIVKKFGQRKDVLFVAPTADESEKLRSFLESRPFDYRIVPSADDWEEAFGVNGWPTHVIIDRDGEVVLRHSGARDILPNLEKTLERLLP